MALGGNPVFNGKNFRTAARGNNPAGSPAGYGSTALAGQSAMSTTQMEDLYNQPSAGPSQMGRMTFDDVIVKTVLSIGVVLVGAAVPAFLLPGLVMPLMIVGMIGGLVLGLVNAFKREPVPGLILAYAFLQGLFVGGLTMILEAQFPNIALQALLGTLTVFAVTLVLFRSGKVRATPKAMKIFMVAIIGYALFSLVNLGLMLFGVTESMFGIRGAGIPGTEGMFGFDNGIPWGLVIGVFAICLAAFSLVIDFTSISDGVRNGAPQKYSWTAAFGLTVTLIWLYIEFIRIIAILRGSE
ncbi:putative YccA/Bax inhibitor family protein [Arthrobacter sp. CAN_A212]|uniref:Bax inhibitor-1/YccA family protein n=1 Tax=unclassified Arthrobacter TaxID=235627 RepID=UPI0018C9DCD3|nr:Bax inhibitor-1/YccA family protein [Arthrobacter sp. CAN_C5]MBP2217818.1 putative YccA/Bax inhibitor family protein [Arthrobacter sp. CAN_C5]